MTWDEKEYEKELRRWFQILDPSQLRRVASYLRDPNQITVGRWTEEGGKGCLATLCAKSYGDRRRAAGGVFLDAVGVEWNESWVVHFWDKNGQDREWRLALAKRFRKAADRKERKVHPERAQKILRATALQVRLLGDEQLEAGFRVGMKDVQPLVNDGLLAAVTVPNASITTISGPLAIHYAGGAAPNFSQLVNEAEKRLKSASPRAVRSVVATKKCGKLFGVSRKGKLPQPLQGSHDLNVAALFAHYMTHSPREAEGWLGEDSVTLNGTFARKTPDVFLFDEAKRLTRVIEVIGRHYRPESLERLHEECERLGVGYEVY